MKTRISTTTKITLVIVVFTFMLSSNVSAQFIKVKPARITKNAIESLILGIHDDIEQIKRQVSIWQGNIK